MLRIIDDDDTIHVSRLESYTVERNKGGLIIVLETNKGEVSYILTDVFEGMSVCELLESDVAIILEDGLREYITINSHQYTGRRLNGAFFA